MTSAVRGDVGCPGVRSDQEAMPGSPDEDAALSAVQALEDALEERASRRVPSSADNDRTPDR